MKKFGCWLVAGVVLAAGLGMAGCMGPIEPERDAAVQYPQVQLESYYLKTWTRVQDAQVHRVANGQLEVAVSVQSLTDEDLLVDYQYRFFRGGTECEEPSGWMNKRIPRKGQAEIKFTSLTPADNYQVTIRYAK